MTFYLYWQLVCFKGSRWLRTTSFLKEDSDLKRKYNFFFVSWQKRTGQRETVSNVIMGSTLI